MSGKAATISPHRKATRYFGTNPSFRGPLLFRLVQRSRVILKAFAFVNSTTPFPMPWDWPVSRLAFGGDVAGIL